MSKTSHTLIYRVLYINVKYANPNWPRRQRQKSAVNAFLCRACALTARALARALRDPWSGNIPDEPHASSHRKLSSRMRSESNRTIFVANAQRPSRDVAMCV
jgi:hypothetical protein